MIQMMKYKKSYKSMRYRRCFHNLYGIFCEKHCPSNLTLTPRQRIALLRETKRLENEGNFTSLENLELRNLAAYP